MPGEPFTATSADLPAVRGFLHRPPSPSPDGLVLTHGAGGNAGAPLLVDLATAFAASRMTVLRCDLPFRQAGLLLLSYPLHPPGRPGDLRTAHLPKLRGRIVFIHGTTDPFGSPEEIEAARALITAPTTLILTDGGHDLGYRKPRRDLIERIVAACASWRAPV
ncbi:MAG: hypothetical protein DME08_24635 [Candidatus Rokuibacteriota bacterium]|nr:MAG: hypothetical protein DME08_24635 [Candidatus Rokubacteria bacterium]